MTKFECCTDLLDNLLDGLYFVDKERKIIYWNKSAEIITGFTASEVVGSHCFDNILKHVDYSGNALCFSGCPLQQTLKDEKIRTTEAFLHHKSGHRVPVTIKTIPLYEDNILVGSVEIFKEILKVDEMEFELERLKSLALIDQLTNLPNRRYIESKMEHKLEEYKTLDLLFGVAFLDIDFFKNVNDTFGHDVGDEVLKMVAKTYSNSVRSSDYVGRWGGEEFIVIFSNCNEDKLKKLSERIRMLVEKSCVKINGDSIKVTISIGATLVKQGDTMDSIVGRADKLMYASKTNGRNICTFD